MRQIRLIIAAFLITSPFAAIADPIVLDFDGATTGSFQTGDLSEDGYTITVNAGHYDIIYVGAGDNAFNIDQVSFGNTTITLTMDGGGLFDVLSFDVFTAANFGNQFDIIAIGGSGNISAPLSTGLFNFGAGFQGISALQIVQNSSGFFAFDDLTLAATSIPEPGTLALLSLGLLGLGLSRRRKIA